MHVFDKSPYPLIVLKYDETIIAYTALYLGFIFIYLFIYNIQQ